MLPTAGWKALDKQNKALEPFAQMMLEDTINEVAAICLRCASVPVFFLSWRTLVKLYQPHSSVSPLIKM